jgi:hypothetical protein
VAGEQDLDAVFNGVRGILVWLVHRCSCPATDGANSRRGDTK